MLTLAVSGGFHSPFMDKAAVSFAEFLKDFILREPEIPVYSNYSAQPYVSDIASGLLFSQINHPVKWQKIIQNMSAEGADVFIEVGAGATLKKFVEKILPGVAAYSIQNYEDISDVSGEVGHTDAEE
ncbi:hypothetical protein SDC9_110464 [bioreactor metagenome]|uniref:[acyl-carrier-protein] S-malonyltransferase n=1 Tax=bioreactor metagenome TaxID=1076179 RepID=A0A645BK36_9ZZZZ